MITLAHTPKLYAVKTYLLLLQYPWLYIKYYKYYSTERRNLYIYLRPDKQGNSVSFTILAADVWNLR